MNRDDGGARLDRAAQLLVNARRSRRWIDALPPDAMPQTLEEAHAIQDRVVLRLGGRGGWKVGAAAPDATPGCAALPATALKVGPATFARSDFHWIGIEAEIAFRFGATLHRTDRPYTMNEVLGAVASVHPAIEIADSRYTDWRSRSALEQVADCGNNGAFIIGPASNALASIDQMQVAAEVWIDGDCRVARTGGNTAGNVQRLLLWLANHCARRGTPIAVGDIVSSGSCTGLEIIEGGEVKAVVGGVGEVSVRIG